MSKLSWPHSLVFKALVLVVVIGLIVVFTQHRLYEKDRELGQVVIQRNLALMQLMAENHVEELLRDAEFIANSPVLKNYLRSMSPYALALAQEASWVLSTLRPQYDQIRYIDRFGIEQIRVNRRNGQSELVTDDLQVKSDRDYVRKGLALKPGETALSPFELSQENGRIEVPYRPALRAIARLGVVGEYYTPGIVVINDNAERLIHRLGTALPANSELILLNEQGGWLAGGGDQDWQFSITPSATFASSHPGLWESIKSSQTGQFELAGECYNYTWHSYRDGEVSSPRWLIGQRRVDAPCTTELLDNVQQGGMRFAIAFGLSFPLLLLWHRASARKRELVSNLEARNEELRLIANESGHGLLRVDAQGCVEWMNREAERLLGWKEADLEGQNLHETCHQFEDGKSLHKGPCPTLEALKTGQTYRSEHERMLDRNGNIVHLTMSVSPYGEDGERRAIVAISDISTHIQKEESLITLATTDSLTGAFNRATLLQQLDAWITHSANPPCAIMLDIDHFKRVNDTYGHNAGDRVLKAFSSTIMELLRKDDVLGRTGGEEFVVAIRNASLKDAVALAERIRMAVAGIECQTDNGDIVRITTSVGVAIYQEGESVEQLLARADGALYRAKHGGRDQVRVG